MKLRTLVLLFMTVAAGAASAWLWYAPAPIAQSLRGAIARHFPEIQGELRHLPEKPLEERLAARGFALGQSVLLRVFKEDGLLELWLERQGRYQLATTYPICKWSGDLGPKLMEGDGQSPEGYYFATSAQLKPDSNYYRAINVGFPNAFDLQKGRTGSFLMIHGDCVSIGCYAMTDAGIDDIYRAVEEAMLAGQDAIAIHLYPFRLTSENLARHDASPWRSFWDNLAEGDRMFLAAGQPPAVTSCNGRYVFAKDESVLPKDSHCRKVVGW